MFGRVPGRTPQQMCSDAGLPCGECPLFMGQIETYRGIAFEVACADNPNSIWVSGQQAKDCVMPQVLRDPTSELADFIRRLQAAARAT